MGSSTASFLGAFHSSFHKHWDFCREAGHLQIIQSKACQLMAHHILVSQELDEAYGKGWVSSSGGFFCCCFQPPSAVFSLPALSRHFHTGVRGWESHGHGTTLGNSVGGDFVALVSCPISTMDTMEKPELFKSVMSFRQSQTPRAELLSELLLPRKLGQHSFGSEGCFPRSFGWKTAGQSCALGRSRLFSGDLLGSGIGSCRTCLAAGKTCG